MSDKQIDTGLVAKAKAAGQAAKGVGATEMQNVSNANLGTNTKKDNNNGGDAKLRSLPQEQQQQRPTGRGGR